MAKKRMKKAARKSRNVKSVQKNVSKVKFMPYSKTANVFVLIAICLLIINAVTLIFLKDTVIKALGDAGTVISSSQLALMGLVWLLVAFFAWSINRTIKEKQSKVSMWELFIISIVALLSGRIESGVLLMIASIIYLVKAKKK